MDSHVIRFFFYTAVALISAARLEASAEESPRVRCIHAWVNSRPEDNAATTEFFPEDRLSRFFENETLPPNLSKKGEIMNLPFYESTRNFCLYFKAADDESEKPMRSNDVHSAFLDLKQNKNASTLSDMDFAYDFVQFYAVIDSICPANETVGIGYIQRIYYNSTSVNERFRQYVKVRWICCRECPLTIDEIELKMLTQMIPFNYKPKKSDYIGPSDKIGLRKRSVSPCVNIYGEIMEIAVPHYSTPVCPMYAVFDPISPGYEFDHEASTTKNLLVKMSDICLMVDNNTDSSECYWRFESLEKPIEMLCCCRSELEEELRKCSRQLRNRVDVSRCFVQHVQPFKRWGAEIDLAGDFKSQGMDIQSPECITVLEMDEHGNGKLTGDTRNMRFPLGDRVKDLQRKCSEERKRRRLSAHCIVEIVKKGNESNQEPIAVCPMDPPLNRQYDDIFKYVCCCTGDLCNVAQAREILLATRRTHESKEAKGVSSKKACPDNEFEHHFAGKGCVKYWHDKQQLNLIENHNFVIKDYIEFGKFSNCSLVEIEFPSTLLAVQKCAEKLEYMKNLADRSITVIICTCAPGKCDRKDQDLGAIDTKSPCNHIHEKPVLESELVEYTSFNNNYTSYCSVAGIYSKKEDTLRKTFQGNPEAMIVNWTSGNQAKDLDLLKPGCRLRTTEDDDKQFECTCQSKSSEACNDVHLMNKVVNLFYNQIRKQEDLDDESKVCNIDGVREVCFKPGCFIVEEPQEDGSSSFKSGCIYRASENEEEDRYARDLCQLTGVKNDCHVIVSTYNEKHVLCCCEGVGCNSEEFSQKRKIHMKTLSNLMKYNVS